MSVKFNMRMFLVYYQSVSSIIISHKHLHHKENAYKTHTIFQGQIKILRNSDMSLYTSQIFFRKKNN